MYCPSNEFSSQGVGERGESCFHPPYQAPCPGPDGHAPLDFLMPERSPAMDQFPPSQSASVPVQDQVFADVISSSADLFSAPDTATDVYANPMRLISTQFQPQVIGADARSPDDYPEGSATD